MISENKISQIRELFDMLLRDPPCHGVIEIKVHFREALATRVEVISAKSVLLDIEEQKE